MKGGKEGSRQQLEKKNRKIVDLNTNILITTWSKPGVSAKG